VLCNNAELLIGHEDACRIFIDARGSGFGDHLRFCSNPDTKCVPDAKSDRGSVGDSECNRDERQESTPSQGREYG
jgi:hypothetical protein